MSLGALIYRTLGAWGAGVGRLLTAAELDGNFWAIQQWAEDLEANPPAANSISNVTQSGNNITVWLEDGTSFGPFALPTATPLIPVDTISAASYTLLLADRGKYMRCTNGGGCGIVIPPDGTLDLPIGTEFYFRQASSGALSFEAGCDVTLNGVAGFSNATATQGSMAMLKKVAADVWDLSGRLTEDITS